MIRLIEPALETAFKSIAVARLVFVKRASVLEAAAEIRSGSSVDNLLTPPYGRTAVRLGKVAEWYPEAVTDQLRDMAALSKVGQGAAVQETQSFTITLTRSPQSFYHLVIKLDVHLRELWTSPRDFPED